MMCFGMDKEGNIFEIEDPYNSTQGVMIYAHNLEEAKECFDQFYKRYSDPKNNVLKDLMTVPFEKD